MAYCHQTGGKFEDSGAGGFPEMSGHAEGMRQSAVYNQGVPCAGMPVVTQWLRPEEFCNILQPGEPFAACQQPMFLVAAEIEGIIQGAGDNKIISAPIRRRQPHAV